ncbi:MAG: hypothetical protein R2698_10685 [Microthrixaceae bacterium]
MATATNAAQAGPSAQTVAIGLETNCNPCGVTGAGTGLRNRESGTITLTGVPEGATVGRAVLVWGILHDGSTPPNTVTFQGTPVSADVSAKPSGTLCWNDQGTMGYAADVTSLVAGNGTYTVSNPPRGSTRPDENPYGDIPLTDGASLVVFYVGGGSNAQVRSDFSFDTNTDDDSKILRTFGDFTSVGGPASLLLVGADGQSNASESIEFRGPPTVTPAAPSMAATRSRARRSASEASGIPISTT